MHKKARNQQPNDTMNYKQEVRPKFHGLDHFRSMAIISVLFYHYLIWAPVLVSWKL